MKNIFINMVIKASCFNIFNNSKEIKETNKWKSEIENKINDFYSNYMNFQNFVNNQFLYQV